MPLELIADRPGHALLQAYEEPPLEPNQVRVRSLFSAVKHGRLCLGYIMKEVEEYQIAVKQQEKKKL